MANLTQDCIGVHPRVRPGLEALAGFLRDRDYATQRIGHILDYVHRHGTLGELVRLGFLDREDEASAEAEYVENLPAVAGLDAAWEDEGIYIDADSMDEALARLAAAGALAGIIEEIGLVWDRD